MIDLCKRCVKDQEMCGTLFTEVEIQTNSFPVKVIKCKHFQNRQEQGHECSTCKNKQLPNCGAELKDVKIAGGRIIECLKKQEDK